MGNITLYHGTSSQFLDSILNKGLKPRKETGVSNWSGDEKSLDDRVYLSNKFEAAIIGRQACKKHGGDFVLLEIVISTQNLVPDEDNGVKNWEESLAKVTCAYHGVIPPDKIKKIWTGSARCSHPKYALVHLKRIYPKIITSASQTELSLQHRSADS